ncbi:hypothetical protein [Aestuariivivens insulae]|uniref:hypothetical protein n=1 Tax=Aestuariivivens insulae TaxID=1621988 RepID=UPI001F5A538D|nr:hypothetical protein [Aestuariivivens insulae]
MGEFKNQQKSIFGTWWEPIRKWFYPAWLVYETSIRFYDYALSVYSYFIEQQDNIGEVITQVLAITCGLTTFLICIFYVTLPVSIILYKFFKDDKPIVNPFIHKIKKYF